MNTISNHYSLKPLNTFALDAYSDRFYRFSSVGDLLEVLGKRLSGEPLLLLGGGSNILFAGDFRGLVLHNQLTGIELAGENSQWVWVKAAAGENWHSFVEWTLARGYSGLENLSLIPGSVGAAPVQNIGAYGVELCEYFEALEAIDLATGELESFTRDQCRFGYRDSAFKRSLKGKYAIVNVTFKLSKVPVFKTGYGEIRTEIEARGHPDLTPRLMSDVICSIRRVKLPDPMLLPNAGSFFKNAVVSVQKRDELLERYSGLKSYALPDGQVKLASGWMIDMLGWKGRRIGNVGVHEHQALVLVNFGGTGKELLTLAEKITEDVEDNFGVTLEPEPVIVK